MPLYDLKPVEYGAYLEFFNCHSSQNVMGKHELRSILQTRGISATNDELQDMIDALSVDGNGINFQAFIDYIADYKPMRDAKAEYADAFRIYDRHGTGFISRDDITFVMQKLKVPCDLNELFSQIETNKEGKIGYREFEKFMQRQL